MTAVQDSTATRLRYTGLAGSFALAAAAIIGGSLPTPDPMESRLEVLAWLRTPPFAKPSAIGIALVGMVLLLHAWWRLGHRVGGPPPVRWAAITAVLWSAPLAFAPPLFSRDVYSYAAQGDVLGRGIDPYAVGPAEALSQWLSSVSPTWFHTPAPYGPLFVQLTHVAASLAGTHLLLAMLLLRITAVAGVALMAIYLPRLARACGVDDRRAMWIGLASPLIGVHFISGVHNDALMLGLMVAGLSYAVERRGFQAVTLITLAATVKAPAAVALPFVAVLWQRDLPWAVEAWPMPGRARLVKACVLTSAVSLSVFAAVTAASGLGIGWVSALGTPGGIYQWPSIPTGLGIGIQWVSNIVPPGLPRQGTIDALRDVGQLVTLALLAILWWRIRHRAGEPRLVMITLGWALVAVVWLAPAVHPWYALWPFIIFSASTMDDRLLKWISGITVGLCFWVMPDGNSLANITQVPGIIADVVLTVLAIRLALRWWRQERNRAAIAPLPQEAVARVGG
jgi:hypothetical protein